MAAPQKTSSLPGSEQVKVYVAVGLVVLLAGYWVYQFKKRSRPARHPAASVASTLDTPRPTVRSPAPQAPALASDKSSVEPEDEDLTGVVAEVLPHLTRDPFTVSEAMAKLMRKIKPADGEGPKADSAARRAGAEEASRLTLKLEATVIDGQTRYGLINGDIVVEGQVYHGMTVRAVREREVILEGPRGAVRLTME